MKHHARASLAAALLAVVPALAQTPGASPGGRSAALLLGQALLSLAVVIAVIYLAYFALRRLSGAPFAAGEDGPLRVLQARHLGGDRWLYLVRVGARYLLIGGAAGHLTAIADLGDGPPGGGSADDQPG